MNRADIKGQDRVVNFLINSLKNERLANAYLFIGPEGIGKSAVAKELAKILNCQNKEFDSCLVCSSCRKIENYNHPDIHWIKKDDSGFIKIEDIRELENDIYLKPYEARKKVYIIEKAESMTEEANNALLKTLEEPPLDSLIILITSQPKRVFSTIASRCQKIYFSSFSNEALEEILSKEHGLNKTKSHFLARFSSGRLGKALKFKDIDILTMKNTIIDNFVYRQDFNRFYTNFKFDSKADVEEVLELSINWFRDILLVKIGFDDIKLINADRIKDLNSLKMKYSFGELFEIMELIMKINRLLRFNINLKIALAELKEKICKK